MNEWTNAICCGFKSWPLMWQMSLAWLVRANEEVGDVTDSQPKFPTGDAWVVFGDNKVGYVLEWRLRWRGEEVGDVVDSPPRFPTGDAWVVIGDNRLWATCRNGG